MTNPAPPHRKAFSRRTALALGGGALAAGGIGLTGGHAMAQSGGGPRNAPFDYGSAEDNMHALVKVMGDLSGKPAFFHAQGRLFGMMPKEHARTLLACEGCAARKFRWDPEQGNYLMSLREWLLFRDLETGEVRDEWENPYTGDTVKLPHFKGGGGAAAHRWTPRGQLRIGQESLWPDVGPQTYDWQFADGEATVTIDQFVAFPSFYPPERFPRASTGATRWELQVRTFHTETAALEDPGLTATTGEETWTMKNNWMGFMNMGKWPGHHLWRAAGRKHISLDGLPDDFVQRSEGRWPGLIAEFEQWAAD